jgi:hypothetical protein
MGVFHHTAETGGSRSARSALGFEHFITFSLGGSDNFALHTGEVY